MRKGWTETTVGEIVELVSRGRAPSYCEEDGIAVINQKCIRNGRISFEFARLTDSKKKSIPDWAFLRVGDTLINSTGVGTLGRASFVARLDATTTFDSHITLVRPNPSHCYPPYVGLFLNFREREIEMFGGGSTGQTELSREAVNAFPITIPPLAEQKRIVDVVSSVDAYINMLQQQADSARVARNAVLHELLSAGVDEWTETTLGPLVTLTTGKLDVNAGVEEGEFPFFTCSRDTYKIDVAVYSGKSVIVAGNGDLNVKYYEGEFNAYQRTYILQAINESVLNPVFLFHFMEKYVDTLRNYTQGSTIQYLKKGQFTEAPIVLPPLAKQERIVEIVSSMDDVVQSTEQAVLDAKNLRSGLLSDLLSGEHEIPASYDSLLGAA